MARQRRTDPAYYRERNNATTRVRSYAVNELVANHRERFDQLYRVECALLALDPRFVSVPVVPHGEEAMDLEEAIVWKIDWLKWMLKEPTERRVEELHQQIAEAQAELAVLEAGGG